MNAGGSANASDTIYREVQRLQEAGKPVVACMGNIAGSGGYYIACPATKIVAQPSTLTGSIGVISGKFNFDAPLRSDSLMFSSALAASQKKQGLLAVYFDELYA